jgi:hypothetical protein
MMGGENFHDRYWLAVKKNNKGTIEIKGMPGLCLYYIDYI